MAHKRSFRLLASGRTVVAWQGNDELGEFAELGLDVDPAAMLLDNDVMCHREAEPGPFPGRFGGEEGIEHLFSHFGRDAGAVIANSDLDCLANISGGRAEHRLKSYVASLDLALGCCIKAVGNQI